MICLRNPVSALVHPLFVFGLLLFSTWLAAVDIATSYTTQLTNKGNPYSSGTTFGLFGGPTVWSGIYQDASDTAQVTLTVTGTVVTITQDFRPKLPNINTLIGTIGPDGTLAGGWSDNQGRTGAGLSWSMTPMVVPPVITAPARLEGTRGQAFSYQIQASGTPTSYNAAPLSAGLTIATATGIISGTPTVLGETTVTLTATNGAGSGTANVVLAILDPVPPVITSATTATATVGTSFEFAVTASQVITLYEAVGLPAGLAISATSGRITGTPTVAGVSQVTVRATNANGTAAKAAAGWPRGTGKRIVRP